MPEWLKSLLPQLASGAIFTAIGAVVVRIILARNKALVERIRTEHQRDLERSITAHSQEAESSKTEFDQDRQVRTDSLKVLYEMIDRLKEQNDEIKKDLGQERKRRDQDRDTMRTELSRARDEHQACMLKYALLEQRLKEMEGRETARGEGS